MIVILLRIVIAGYPVSRMVSRHCELGQFFFHDKIDQILLLGKFIPEPQPVVKQTKPDNHITVGGFLSECYRHLVVMVADLFGFAPYRFPCLVESTVLYTGHTESVIQGCLRIFLPVYFRAKLHLRSEERRVGKWCRSR